jgi:two-component system response regulator NreC
MLSRIRVAILDDHQSIIDGLSYRLSMNPRIQIVSTATYGEELEPMISENEIDVLLLDVSVPNTPENHNPFPVLHIIPRLLKNYPKLSILIISMFTQHSLIDALVNTGISGYIFKDDQSSIQEIDKIVEKVANGGIYFSQGAYWDPNEKPVDSLLTERQLEALSLSASRPDGDTISLAKKLGISGSTMSYLGPISVWESARVPRPLPKPSSWGSCQAPPNQKWRLGKNHPGSQQVPRNVL